MAFPLPWPLWATCHEAPGLSPRQVSFGPVPAAEGLSSSWARGTSSEISTFTPHRGLGGKGQMEVAAVWKLGAVTFPLPPQVQAFLSLAPHAGRFYRFLPTMKSPGALPQSWQALLSLLPLLRSS